MWIYEKKLQKPVKITNSDPAMAKIIITQLSGPDGETGAAMRYLSQRYAMPNNKVKAVLTDIGTEELGHMEMISAIVHQLRAIFPLRKSSPAALRRTLSTTRPEFTRWMPAVFRLMRQHSSPPVTP